MQKEPSLYPSREIGATYSGLSLIHISIGLHIIEQARNVLVQTHRIKNIIEEEKHSLSGIFKLGILPTIAPYLLPRFFPQLMKKYPQLDIRVVEMKTNDIKKADVYKRQGYTSS